VNPRADPARPASAVPQQVVSRVVPVARRARAELAKLLENIFRLREHWHWSNELKQLSLRMNIGHWE